MKNFFNASASADASQAATEMDADARIAYFEDAQKKVDFFANKRANIANAVVSPDSMPRGAARLNASHTEEEKELREAEASIYSSTIKARRDAYTNWSNGIIDGLKSGEGPMPDKAALFASLEEYRNFQAQKDYNRIVFLTMQNMLMANGKWSQAFEICNLEHDQKPFLYNSTQHKCMEFTLMSKDGSPKLCPPTEFMQEQPLSLHFLSSCKVELTLACPDRGHTIYDRQVATLDLAGDRLKRIEKMLKPYLQKPVRLPGMSDAAFAELELKSRFCDEFNIGTDVDKSHEWDYHVDDCVERDNLPKGNCLKVSNIGDETTLSLDVIQNIIAYTTAWGTNAWGMNSTLSPMIVCVPSGDYAGLIQQFSMESRKNCVTDQLCEEMSVINFGGIEFILYGDNTINPKTHPFATVIMNRPVGIQFEKPELQGEFREIDFAKNMETRWLRSAIGFGMPRQWKPFIFSVQYRNFDAASVDPSMLA